MEKNIWEHFREFVHINFGLELSKTQIAYFKTYLSELKLWNEKFNLVSFKTDEELVFRHFADSLAAFKTISKYQKNQTFVADIGTGAGFPGIPIKIAMPETKLTLIESVTKKCAFLENIRTSLRLSDTEILNDRSENIGQDKKYREIYDFVLSRATAKISPTLEFALPLLEPGGHFILFKTENSAFGEEGVNSAENAITTLGGVFTEHFCYNLPGQPITYCVLVFEKIKTTPKEYPRKTGIPEKKPL